MAGTEPKKHHHIEFASKHAKNSIRSLRAFSALARAESLIDDIKSLMELKKECEAKGIYFGRFIFTYEVINYYAVGLVTCLEWHVRSRVVDLLSFNPECIRKEDIKAAKEEALSQMMMEEVTVPHLVGAAVRVTSTASYAKEMQRIFDGLKIKSRAEDLLRKQEYTIERWGQKTKKSLFDVLDELFEIRHSLVHEIGWGVIGHFSLRDLWELERPLQFGEAVLKCIQLIEAEITKHANTEFPNRLDEDFCPEDDLEKLKNTIASLESKLAKHYAGDNNQPDPSWTKASKANAEAIAADVEVIDNSLFLRPVRHLDYREEMEMDLLKSRLRYLTLLSEASDWYAFDEESESDK